MLLDLVVIGTIVVLALALVFRSRVAVGISASAGVVFACLALVALSALFAPGIYERAAAYSLEQTGIVAQIRSIDDRLVLNDVADVSSDLLGRVQDWLGQPTPETPGAPTAPSRLVEDNVLPGLVSLVATLFRIGAVILSLSAMIGLVALQFASALYSEREDLSAAVAALERRVAGLEGGHPAAGPGDGGQPLASAGRPYAPPPD
jgi:hypothetical protein